MEMANLNDGGTKKEATSKKRNRDDDDHDEEYMPVPETNGVIRRVFSHKDEITLLKALAKQENKSDMKLLFDTVATSLDAKVNKKQVAEKVSKLKKKSLYNKKTTSCAYKDLDPHQKRLSKLSDKIWGPGSGSGAGAGGDHQTSKNLTNVDEILFVYPCIEYVLEYMYSSEYLPKVRRRLASLCQRQLGRMERHWFLYYYRKMQHGNKRMRLVQKVSKLVDEAAKAYILKPRNNNNNNCYNKMVGEFMEKYPGIDSGLCDLYPPGALSSGRLHMLRRMVASYPCCQELDALQDKWDDFDEDSERLHFKLVQVIDQQIDLVEKATGGEVIPTLTTT